MQSKDPPRQHHHGEDDVHRLQEEGHLPGIYLWGKSLGSALLPGGAGGQSCVYALGCIGVNRCMYAWVSVQECVCDYSGSLPVLLPPGVNTEACNFWSPGSFAVSLQSSRVSFSSYAGVSPDLHLCKRAESGPECHPLAVGKREEAKYNPIDLKMLPGGGSLLLAPFYR